MSEKSSISFRELARRLGVTDMAVRKAVKSGRLSASVGETSEGRPCIIDAELALVEWSMNAGANPANPPANPAGSRTERASETPAVGADAEVTAQTLNEAQRIATIERARKLRLENQKTRGRLIDLAIATKQAFEAERIIREALLNLPARLSSELAAESDAGRVYLKLDGAIREALTSVAGQYQAMAANG